MVFTKKIKELYSKNKYIATSLFTVGITGFTNVLTYISSIYTNRSLSVEDFAQYNALLSIITIVISTFSSYGYFMMQNFENKKEYESLHVLYGIIVSVATVLLYIIFSPLLPYLFNITNYKAIYIAALFLFSNMLSVIWQAVIRENGFITQDYLINFFSVFFMRIILLAIFIITGLSLTKSFFSMSFYAICYCVLQIIFIKRYKIIKFKLNKNRKEILNSKTIKNILILLLPIISVNFIFSSLLGFDVIMAKRYLNAEYAGYYSTLSFVIKMFYYISLTVSILMYTNILKEGVLKSSKEKNIILNSVIIISLFLLILSLVFLIFSKEIILFQFSSRYSILINLMPVAVFFGLSVSSAVFVFYYFLAQKIYKYFYFYLVLFFSSYLALRNLERNFNMFIKIFSVFFAVLFIYNILIFILHRIHIKKQTSKK